MRQHRTGQPEDRQPAAADPDLSRHRHDELFRRIFADRRLARRLIRESLPEELAVRMDDGRARCERIPDVHVRQSGRKVQFDGLFRLRLPVPGGGSELEDVYVLAEHKSTPDWRAMAQLMSYRAEVSMVKGFQTGTGAARRHPAVIALLLYSGHREWPFGDDFAAMVNRPTGVSDATAALLTTGVVRRSLAGLGPEDLSGDRVLRGALTMEVLSTDPWLAGGREPTAARRRRWRRQFEQVVDCLADADNGEYFHRWLFRALGGCRAMLEAALEGRRDGGGMGKVRQYMVTLAQQFRQEGRAEAWPEALAEGRTEGRTETVLRQLEHRFGPLDEEQHRRVLEAGPDGIDRITFGLLNAASFDDAVNGSNSG